ncbi:MAG: hypothetical protein A3K19_05660 [Lentisphaerae bacterium RIFOXYB12_FULL_65_16]|nr:MAG: hypothetical protein A3K19_05660 [Lentisphaerae bacterium RIFOXYB12_FULL_65_16]
MLTLVEPLPVKVFAGMLWSDRVCFASALAVMEAAWGECDVRGEPVPFTVTDYYVAEMGAGLQRQFVAFETLVNPDALPTLKLTANRIEADSATAGQRRVNIDVGYLDYHRVVLASTKEGPFKIYVGQGIWADMTLHYASGRFEPFAWTFQDLRTGAYDGFFRELRRRYKAQVRVPDRAHGKELE